MLKINVVLAFALGSAATSAISRVAGHGVAQDPDNSIVHVCADKAGLLHMIAGTATCPDDQRSLWLKRAESDIEPEPSKDKKKESSFDQAKLDELERRVKKLEGMEAGSVGKSRVVAPFEVVDRTGKRIFYVNTGIAELYNSGGKSVAWMAASASGGNFVAQSVGGGLMTTFGASGQSNGMLITEGDKKRVDLGRRPDKGTYRLLFYGGAKEVAGIGQSIAGTGLAFVATEDGVFKARMSVASNTRRGRVWISKSGDDPIAELTEGDHGGGLFFVCSGSGGCNPPMVDAGDAGGYGLVRTGPLGFNPGVGLLGMPGSFIMGKK